MGNNIRPALKKTCACCRSAPKTLEKKYDVPETDVLGEGTFAKVFKGTNRKTKKEVAVKIIDKANSRQDLLNTEIWILQNFGNHPNILNFYDMYETETEVQLVIEFMPGGELFDFLDENGPYGEADAAKHLQAIASGLAYLHAGNVVHRDLKPENLLLTSKGPTGVLKISDFGLAKILIDEELMKVACGTWIYCAPEVLNLKQRQSGQYDVKCDIFSIGCILFLIMGGYHPFDFDGNDDEELMQECILSDTWDFEDPAWDEVSYQAKDLIEQMLRYNPKERISAAEIAVHPWTTGRVAYGRLSQSIDKNLKKTRASLRNNKLEGAEMVRKSLKTTAGAMQIAVQDVDEVQQARAAPELAELQEPAAATSLQSDHHPGHADGTGGSKAAEVPVMEVDAGTGGGALELPKRRISPDSNNSPRSCPQRRKAAAVPEDKIPEVKEDRFPKRRAGQPGATDASAADISKHGVLPQNVQDELQSVHADATGTGQTEKAEARPLLVADDVGQVSNESSAEHAETAGSENVTVDVGDPIAKLEKIIAEELKIGCCGSDSEPPATAEPEDGIFCAARSTKRNSWGSKRKKVDAPKEQQTFRPSLEQLQVDTPELRNTKSVDWSKMKSTKSVTTVDEWKAKRVTKLIFNNANAPVKVPIGKIMLPEPPEALEISKTCVADSAIDQAASVPLENPSIQRRNSKKKAISIDQKSTASRNSRSLSQKKKAKGAGDPKDAVSRLSV